MVTHLTTSGNCPLDSSGMPSSDTSDLAETSVRFTVESLDTESLDDTGITFTSGDTNDVAHLVLGENLVDEDILLKFGSDEIDFVLGGTTVNLDFH